MASREPKPQGLAAVTGDLPAVDRDRLVLFIANRRDHDWRIEDLTTKQIAAVIEALDLAGVLRASAAAGEGHAPTTHEEARSEIWARHNGYAPGICAEAASLLVALGHAREGLSREEVIALAHAVNIANVHWHLKYGDLGLAAKLRGWLASPAPEGDEP